MHMIIIRESKQLVSTKSLFEKVNLQKTIQTVQYIWIQHGGTILRTAT